MPSSDEVFELEAPALAVKHSPENDFKESQPPDELKASDSQAETKGKVTKGRAAIIIIQLTAVTFLTSISTGLTTVSIPRIAADLDIRPQLYYWLVSL